MRQDRDFEVRDRREPRHWWADNEVIDDYLPAIEKGERVYALAVYAVLCRYAYNRTGEVERSIGQIGEDLGISKPTVRKAIVALEKAEMIFITKQPIGPERAVAGPHIYTLRALKKREDGGDKPHLLPNEIYQGVVNHVDHPGKPDLPGVVNHVDPLINKTVNKTIKDDDDRARAEIGGGVVEFFCGHSVSEDQITRILDASGEKITGELLARWQAVIDCPPRGLESPVAVMIARLSKGDLTVPRPGKPAPVASTEKSQPSLAEVKAAGATRRAAIMEARNAAPR